jgi:hypothetical protein
VFRQGDLSAMIRHAGDKSFASVSQRPRIRGVMLLIMAGSHKHVQPLRLYDLARDGQSQITEEERSHLRECEECQRILAVFAREFTQPGRRPKDIPGDAA